jgi:hypothetical protein
MNLPISKELPIEKLAACFNSTSATYKFYWLLSVLQELEYGNVKILKINIFARMISTAWYTVNYFNVSFGKQDLIQENTRLIKEIENIPVDKSQQFVYSQIINSQNPQTKKLLWHFNKYVPHRFLSPWFIGKNEKYIYAASQSFNNKCLYALHEDYIEINKKWKDYLITNSKILKDFCYWNLSLFLQARNPSVPDIPNKLIKPPSNRQLSKQRNNYWNIVFQELGTIKCIYTGKDLTSENYEVEHFIPHSFVSHNLIWNLLPADPSFNSTKSNKLPPLERYFVPFFEIQKTAVEIINKKDPRNIFLQDYLVILPDIENSFTEVRFKEAFQPLITIASNNGFEFME